MLPLRDGVMPLCFRILVALYFGSLYFALGAFRYLLSTESTASTTGFFMPGSRSGCFLGLGWLELLWVGLSCLSNAKTKNNYLGDHLGVARVHTFQLSPAVYVLRVLEFLTQRPHLSTLLEKGTLEHVKFTF